MQVFGDRFQAESSWLCLEAGIKKLHETYSAEYTVENSWWWERRCPKYVEFYNRIIWVISASGWLFKRNLLRKSCVWVPFNASLFIKHHIGVSDTMITKYKFIEGKGTYPFFTTFVWFFLPATVAQKIGKGSGTNITVVPALTYCTCDKLIVIQ
jgi:hypothetical protein